MILMLCYPSVDSLLTHRVASPKAHRPFPHASSSRGLHPLIFPLLHLMCQTDIIYIIVLLFPRIMSISPVFHANSNRITLVFNSPTMKMF